jgi:hypothetical protein
VLTYGLREARHIVMLSISLSHRIFRVPGCVVEGSNNVYAPLVECDISKLIEPGPVNAAAGGVGLELANGYLGKNRSGSLRV